MVSAMAGIKGPPPVDIAVCPRVGGCLTDSGTDGLGLISIGCRGLKNGQEDSQDENNHAAADMLTTFILYHTCSPFDETVLTGHHIRALPDRRSLPSVILHFSFDLSVSDLPFLL